MSKAGSQLHAWKLRMESRMNSLCSLKKVRDQFEKS